MAWRRHLDCEPVALGSMAEQLGRLAVSKLRVKGADILLMATYLWTGVGPTGPNVQLLASMAAALQAAGLPWIAYGDWQMSPLQLESTGWMQKMGGEVLGQPNLEATCWTGELGERASYID